MNIAAGQQTDWRRQEVVQPNYEDYGLFKGQLSCLKLNITPSMKLNGRSDAIVDGFVNKDTPVALVFAGRRRLLFGPLKSRLQFLESKHKKNMQDVTGEQELPDIRQTDVRLPIVIEGAWRMLFDQAADGFQVRTRQFVAARWMFKSESGLARRFGETPSHMRASVGML